MDGRINGRMDAITRVVRSNVAAADVVVIVVVFGASVSLRDVMMFIFLSEKSL